MKLLAIDFETTGLSPTHGAEIIEIGAVKFVITDAGIIEEDSFQVFCKPKRPIPSKITQINGITNNDVKDALPVLDEWSRFLEWAGEFDHFVAHNAKFDAKFMCFIYNKEALNMPEFTIIDTLELARRRIKGQNSYKLDSLAKSLNINIEISHRALSDARAAAHLLGFIYKTYKNPLSSIANSAVKVSSLGVLEPQHPQSSKSKSFSNSHKADAEEYWEGVFTEVAREVADRKQSTQEKTGLERVQFIACRGLLIIGIVFLPIVFAWFTLKKGFGLGFRLPAFVWMAFFCYAMILPGDESVEVDPINQEIRTE